MKLLASQLSDMLGRAELTWRDSVFLFPQEKSCQVCIRKPGVYNAYFDIDCLERGAPISVNAVELFEFLRIADGEEIELEDCRDLVTVRCGSVQTRLYNTPPLDDFEHEDTTIVELGHVMGRYIVKPYLPLLPSTPGDIYATGCVVIMPDGDRTRYMMTDERIMVVIGVDHQTKDTFVIPAKAFTCFNGYDTIYVGKNGDGRVTLKSENVAVVSHYARDIPNFKKVLKKLDGSTPLRIPLGKLAEFMRRIQSARSNTGLIIVSVGKGEMVIYADTKHITVKATESIPYQGDRIYLSFDVEQVTILLDSLYGESVEMMLPALKPFRDGFLADKAMFIQADTHTLIAISPFREDAVGEILERFC